MNKTQTTQNTKLYLTIMATFAVFFLAPKTSHARPFTNQFVEFELPTSNWNCSLEGAEWVCQSQDDKKKRDAIIVLAAKLKGQQDSLDQYQAYLNKPRSFSTPGGKTVSSQPKYSKLIQINGHTWVDSIHLESEIPGFYTRYLATIKEDIGILVTYSVNKGKYQEYLTQFEDMVKSLKAFRKQGGMLSKDKDLFAQNSQLQGQFTAPNVFPETQNSPDTGASKPKAAKSDDTLLYLGLLAVAIVGYIIYKRKKNQS